LLSAAVFQLKIRGGNGTREQLRTETRMIFPDWSPVELVETSVAALVEPVAGPELPVPARTPIRTARCNVAFV
jgi:hypothetical protein